MKLFGKTRLNIGNRTLRKKVSKIDRKVSYSSINDVKKVGIVWDANNPDEFSTISLFHSKMGKRDIDVKVIGYYDSKVLPSQYTAIKYLHCIKKDNISFFYRPKTEECDTFISENFDVLIDNNPKMIFPLYYITSLSRAKFKVGGYNDNLISPFDLVVEKGKLDLSGFLEQVERYLEMISDKKK